MPSPFKAADITTSHRSPKAARRHRPSGSSAAPSAAWLAAEAAFSDVPAQRRPGEARPVAVEREESFAPAPVAASVSTPLSTPLSVETSIESKTPRVFRVSRVAPEASAGESPLSEVAGLQGPVDAGPEAEGAPSQPVPRPVRRRRDTHATLSGPVTVLSPPASATPAVEGSAGESSAVTSSEREWPAFVLPPSLNELLEDLAGLTATLKALRRVPARDFQVRPNQEAWSRLSREADALLVDIRAARRR